MCTQGGHFSSRVAHKWWKTASKDSYRPVSEDLGYKAVETQKGKQLQVVRLPKKVNIGQCQNYRTINLIGRHRYAKSDPHGGRNSLRWIGQTPGWQKHQSVNLQQLSHHREYVNKVSKGCVVYTVSSPKYVHGFTCPVSFNTFLKQLSDFIGLLLHAIFLLYLPGDANKRNNRVYYIQDLVKVKVLTLEFCKRMTRVML